jgi:hypothetical protein
MISKTSSPTTTPTTMEVDAEASEVLESALELVAVTTILTSGAVLVEVRNGSSLVEEAWIVVDGAGVDGLPVVEVTS